MSEGHYHARLLALDSLEAVSQEMARIAVDKGGIPIMSGKALLRMVLIEQVPTAAANVIKQEILARGGDLATPWSAAGFDAPFVDVIVIGNLTTLRSTISKLYRQVVFDLAPLADAIQNVLVRTTPGYLPVSPRPSRQGVVVEETLEDLLGGRIPLEPGTHRATGRPTCIPIPDHRWRFGAQTHVMHPLQSQSDLDQSVGAVADLIELRLGSTDDPSPAVRHLREGQPEVAVAVTVHEPSTAVAVLRAGAHILRLDSLSVGLLRSLAGTQVPVILPINVDDVGQDDFMTAIARSCVEAIRSAREAGLAEEQLILDVGSGSGQTVQQGLDLTRRLRELTSYGRPLLYSPPPWSEDLAERTAHITMAIANGADIIRVQSPNLIVQAIVAADRLVRGE